MRIPFAALVVTFTASIACAQVVIPPHSSIYNGFSRGYSFTAATNFLITQLELPLDAQQAGDTAGFLVRTNGVVALHSIGNAGPTIATNILINNGDVVDVIGNWSPAVPGSFTAHNSYTASMTNFATSILGVPHTIQRCGWQHDIGDPNYTSAAFLAASSGAMGRVLMYVTPQSGLFANFSADVTGGPTPLTVNFSDQSFSSATGGITSWAWDFDGDNVIDSNLRNPTFIYNNCGSFNVSLTVTDSQHPPSTSARNGYIVTDRIAADFTYQVIGPLTVQFTDTSSVPATTWAWDLDGDNVTDSTVQNPVWVYSNTTPVNVTLTVTRLCSPTSTTTKTVVAAQSLSHNVAPNNGLSSGASVYFDVTVNNPAGVAISALDVFGSVINVPFTVDMWVMPGTHAGAEGTAASWVKVGTASGTSASATTLPSNAAFPVPVYLPAGVSGVKLQYIGTGPRYQTGTGTTVVTVGNGDLSLTLGTSRGSTVANPWAGSNIASRWWSGTVYYGTYNVTGLAAFGPYSPGCAGTLGVSHQTATLPRLGMPFAVTLDNLPQSSAILIVGFSNTSSTFGPLPLDATPFGAPGCFGRVSTDLTAFVFGSGNTATWSLTLPNNPSFGGWQLFDQGVSIDPGFNPLGATFGDAAAWIVGS